MHRFSQVALSIILGMAITSLIPFALQMWYIPLTPFYIFSLIVATFLLLTLSNYKQYRQLKINTKLPRVTLYEIPPLLLIGVLLFVSFNFSLLIPPVPRDLLSGPEPISQYALTEYSFINSVYQQEMPFNNGPFKSLYIPSLQLIYKIIGFSFGKIWLPILVSSFVLFLYSETRTIVNPLIASLLILFFMFCPEPYGYTYLVLYDYSNMIYYFASIYFLYLYLSKDELGYILLSSLLMGIATYIRPETLILSSFICGIGILYRIFTKKRHVRYLLPILLIGFASMFFYFVSSYIYLNYYLPVFYNVEGMINNDLTNITPLIDRLRNTASKLIFSKEGFHYYGYIFYVFIILIILELAVFRKFSRNSIYWLSAFFITYFAIAFMGFLLPLADLNNTTKRSLFKLLPIIVLYLANNKLMLTLSNRIYKYLTPVVLPLAIKNKKKKRRLN